MAIDLFNDFATNPTAEQDGVWEPYNGGVEFLIARSHNPKFDRMITMLVKKNKQMLDSKTEAATAKSEELMVQTMANTILLGWKGEFNFQGQPMGDYTVEKAKKLLAIKDFRLWVSNIADDHERFKAVKDAEDAEK